MIKEEQDINNKDRLEKYLLYSIQGVNWKNSIKGVFIEEGIDWILIASNPVDYIIDGYYLVNKRFILSIERTEEEIFCEKVLLSNNKINTDLSLGIPLKTEMLFSYLYVSRIVFQFIINEKDVFYIGVICRLFEKSLQIKQIGVKGNWLKDYSSYQVDSISLISLNSDYLNSLIVYNKSLSK